ncbi:hypothetical protein JYB64_00585 [Algoriphagus aestuarii]|nr:hypothetical protein [Algoriphagus aestuarii]
MPKIKIKFEGIIEIESSDLQSLSENKKFQVTGTFDKNSITLTEIVPQKEEDDNPVTEAVSKVVIPVVTGTTKVEEPQKPKQLWKSENITLEQFGGEGYYKLIESGLTYEGFTIKSDQPIFSKEDVGKTFCGLFAHNNPLIPDKDLFYPGIKGSRYALVTDFVSSTEIVVNFEFNAQSDKGYIFFDNSMAFKLAVDAAKRSPSKILELQDDQVYVIPQYNKSDFNTDFFLIAKKGASLKIGWEDFFQWSEINTIKQDAHLFDVGGNSLTIGTKNVNFLPPFRRLSGAQLFFTSLFKGQPNSEQQLNVIVESMDTTLEVTNKDPRYNQFGFGFGFMYSSNNGNYIVGKNISHRGPGFMDFKANYGGGLYAVFENIQTDFKDEDKFASTKFKVRGNLKNNIFTITSQNTIYQIYSYDFGTGNVAHILHFGRFTFMIDGKDAVINATQFRVRPYAKGPIKLKVQNNQMVLAKKVELHAGDELMYQGLTYKIIEKTRTYVTEWMQGDDNTRYAMGLKLDKPLPMDSGIVDFEVKSIGESLNNGIDLDAYLIYKANYEFRSYVDTKFGDREILDSTPVGHLSYNHKEISLWAKKFKHNGFYRQSLSHVGATNGYTLIDCEGFDGQFNPEVEITKSGDMPTKAKELLRELDKKLEK